VRFCDRCGSYMERGLNGLVCPKCGYEVAQSLVEVRRPDRPSAEPVYVVESVAEGSLKVTQRCPQCGNNEAYRAVLTTIGEHAGVKQDRAVERYTCTECHHTWVKS
jgi:DNA-directed RNA polymerase subunit M/transcription elongation factor TFIIS